MERLSSVQDVVAASGETAKPLARLLLERYFLSALLACTWIPIAFFLLFAPPDSATGGLAGIKAVFLFLGTAHVPATLYFYTDKDFRGIINRHRLRYVYVPILLILTSGLLFAVLNATGQAFLLLVYWAWQAFHYGRQNTGVYAFASIAQTGKAPQRAEKLAIDVGTILGIVGTFKILGATTAPTVLHGSFDRLYQLGSFGFVALLIFSVVIYLRFFRTTTVFKTLFFFTSVFFFLPVFISTDLNIAFLSYAMAHGLQYITFMSVVSVNSRPESARSISYRGVVTLGLLILVVGFAFWRVADLQAFQMVRNSPALSFGVNFLFGAVLGATMSHFVIDASAWKLSLAAQRAYISKRFAFIFDKRQT